jgi:hypothetical protein
MTSLTNEKEEFASPLDLTMEALFDIPVKGEFERINSLNSDSQFFHDPASLCAPRFARELSCSTPSVDDLPNPPPYLGSLFDEEGSPSPSCERSDDDVSQSSPDFSTQLPFQTIPVFQLHAPASSIMSCDTPCNTPEPTLSAEPIPVSSTINHVVAPVVISCNLALPAEHSSPESVISQSSSQPSFVSRIFSRVDSSADSSVDSSTDNSTTTTTTCAKAESARKGGTKRSREKKEPSCDSKKSRKRAMNKVSAAKYRQKRKKYFDGLEDEIMTLKTTVKAAEAKYEMVQSDNRSLVSQLSWMKNLLKINNISIPEPESSSTDDTDSGDAVRNDHVLDLYPSAGTKSARMPSMGRPPRKNVMFVFAFFVFLSSWLLPICQPEALPTFQSHLVQHVSVGQTTQFAHNSNVNEKFHTNQKQHTSAASNSFPQRSANHLLSYFPISLNRIRSAFKRFRSAPRRTENRQNQQNQSLHRQQPSFIVV